VLIEEVSGLSLSLLRVDFDLPISPRSKERLDVLTQARLAGVPLQHLVGHWPFRYVDLLVDHRALIPRPETEVVVGVALVELELLRTRALVRNDDTTQILRVADLGTGAGAIACALVNEDPRVEVFAVDRSRDALELAVANIARLTESERLRVNVLEGNWFVPLREPALISLDLVIANPPYLAVNEWADLDPVVRDHDPYEALVAGETGLEDLATIIGDAPGHFLGEGVVVCEIGALQAHATREIAAEAGASSVDVLRDLAGRERVLVARFFRG
jgi:release factor glutamine methyltransferase